MNNVMVLVLIASAVLAVSCGQSVSDPAPINSNRFEPSSFIGGATPQLDMASPTPDWVWNDPHVLKSGPSYIMYASGVHVDFSATKWDYPERLFRFVSIDGVVWSQSPASQVLADAPPTEWDAGGSETPAVVFFNGKYHLFYTGYKYDPDTAKVKGFGIGVNFTQVGHAVSDDGITFVRDSVPLVSPSHAKPADSDFYSKLWFCDAVGEPGPVVYNGQLYLYFTALGGDATLNNSLQTIGFIKTSDGKSWSAPESTLKPDQSVYPRIVAGGNGKDGWAGYSTPNAVVINNSIHLFFDVAYSKDTGGGVFDWLQLRLHHAWSPDGVSGWTQDSTAIRANTDFAWTSREIRSPSALLDGSVLRLYFAGDYLSGSAFDFGIGMMSCDLIAK